MSQNRILQALTRILVLVAGIASTRHASGQTLISDVTYQFLGPGTGTPALPRPDPNAAYSNVSQFGGSHAPGTANGTPPATAPVLDDFSVATEYVGKQVRTIRVVAYNSSASKPVRAITQFGLWNADGFGGIPLTPFVDGGRFIGYITPEHDFQPGYTLITLAIGNDGFNAPNATLWAGLAYTQPTPTVPIGYADVAAMGYMRSGAPSIGSTLPGGGLAALQGLPFGSPMSFFGAISSIGPLAVELVVPAPASLGVTVISCILLARRSRTSERSYTRDNRICH